MMRRAISLLFLLATLAAAAFAADLPSAWRSWRYSRAIEFAAAHNIEIPMNPQPRD